MKVVHQKVSEANQGSGLVYGTYNGNFALSHQVHMDHIREYTRKGDGAKVLAVQEMVARVDLDGYRTIQRKVGHNGEALLIHKSLTVVRWGFKDCTPNDDDLGKEISDRCYPWAVFSHGQLGTQFAIGVHISPDRLGVALRAKFAESLRDRLEKTGVPWVALGDFNESEEEDPCGLEARFDPDWAGDNIDLQAWSKRHKGQLNWWATEPRQDGHVTVFAMNRQTIGMF